jgi:SpoVK/Ycf46/Vps4 family AAA+-type ATPase
VPVIWITNRIEQIDPAFRRRFQYHLELKSPPPGARESLVARALAGVGVGEGFAAKLAGRKGLTPALIRTAVKFAKLAGDTAADSGATLEALIERQLVNADKALGNVAAERGARRVVTTYDLGLVNTESRFEVPKIVEALRRRSHGTLCFYGPPGTG